MIQEDAGTHQKKKKQKNKKKQQQNKNLISKEKGEAEMRPQEGFNHVKIKFFSSQVGDPQIGE